MRGLLIGLLMLLGLGSVAQAQLQTPAAVNGCIYLSALPTLVNGQRVAFTCDVNGRLLVSAATAASIATGATLTGCSTANGILFNNANAIGCSTATVTAAGILAVATLAASATIRTGGYTVGTLPAGTVGMRAYVTDQLTACAVTGAVITGGGAVVCPVFYNGTAWVGG